MRALHRWRFAGLVICLRAFFACNRLAASESSDAFRVLAPVVECLAQLRDFGGCGVTARLEWAEEGG
jgi:hypothetical protein